MNKESPDNITKLAPNEIFVFGSNLSGRHGKGAAKQAMSWGAIYGQKDGLQGRTYGIPTVGVSVYKSLSVEQIKPYVDTFVQFAKDNPNLTFLVTEIGCGLAGHKSKDIAPLFEQAKNVENIHLPKRFIRILYES